MKIFILVLTFVVIVTARRGGGRGGSGSSSNERPEGLGGKILCVDPALCVALKIYNGCQCDCPAIACNSFQALNQATCTCECLYPFGAPTVRSRVFPFFAQSPCFAPLVWNQAQCNCAAAAV